MTKPVHLYQERTYAISNWQLSAAIGACFVIALYLFYLWIPYIIDVLKPGTINDYFQVSEVTEPSEFSDGMSSELHIKNPDFEFIYPDYTPNYNTLKRLESSKIKLQLTYGPRTETILSLQSMSEIPNQQIKMKMNLFYYFKVEFIGSFSFLLICGLLILWSFKRREN